ncbi:hypothetical protein BP5796_03777 [Coleophoma crateriformis]|uniref:Major facilitator superfamily (MFS) profile domain-containing protein n=1 Tax=Coleophoma crateriformis TaxID=565419 RepID=A0A3D8SGQ7_9HELO|nr:hypothetical protein BP5796_03777 [Coleophoma crateriformis]
MQSYLQYKRLGRAVKEQLERDKEKALARTISATIEIPRPLSAARIASPSDSDEEEEGVTQYTNINRPRVSLTHTQTHDEKNNDHLNPLRSAWTRYSQRTALGYALDGIHPRERTTQEGKGSKIFLVGWESAEDPLDPHNYSKATRLSTTFIVGLIAFVVGAASSIDVAILPQASADFGVSDVVESMATGLYLAGFAFGAVFAGPFSETFGRNAIYIVTMVLYMIFIMASGLAPNIGAQLTFRFIAGFFGSTPLTCAGGSISDLWNQLEKTYAFALYAIAGFGGPVLGPVIGSYVGNGIIGSWRWTEYLTLIMSGLVLGLVILFQIETYPPLLLKWKAEHLRRLTGDDRFCAEIEITSMTLWVRLKMSMKRPFLMMGEPIILLMALYLTVLYIVLFTFLDGYTYIFMETYGISQGLTNIVFVGIFVGITMSAFLVPFVLRKTKQEFAKSDLEHGGRIHPEIRLWYGMLGGSFAIPVSLFWMGWTDYVSISIWSPIMASVLFGYGLICIFMSAYMYIIDAYEIYAASALTFITFTRYLVAGGMTIVGIPFYKNVGTHWTLTIMACISALLVPIPFVLFKWGHRIRERSKYAVA